MSYRGSLKCLPLEWMNYPELAKKVRLNVADMIKSPEKAVENFKMLIHGKVCWFTASSYVSDINAILPIIINHLHLSLFEPFSGSGAAMLCWLIGG